MLTLQPPSLSRSRSPANRNYCLRFPPFSWPTKNIYWHTYSNPLSGTDIASDQSVLTQNESKANGKTTTNEQMNPNGHEHQRLAPASCRRFSRQLKVLAALVTFCSTVILGSVALMHNKYSRWVVFGFSRRVTGMVESGAGTLRIIPSAERPVLSSAFPDFSGSGFNSKSNNLKTNSPGSNNPKIRSPNRNNPKGNPPKRNDQKRNSLKRNSLKRNLHALDTLPRVGDLVNGDEIVERPPTLLFMHLWKCAGSSLRHLLRDWAQLEEQSIVIVVRCTDVVTHVSRRFYMVCFVQGGAGTGSREGGVNNGEAGRGWGVGGRGGGGEGRTGSPCW